jgi:hypothetical protein
VHHALHKNCSCADYDHVVGESLLPRRLPPQGCAHGAADALDVLVQTVAQNV